MMEQLPNEPTDDELCKIYKVEKAATRTGELEPRSGNNSGGSRPRSPDLFAEDEVHKYPLVWRTFGIKTPDQEVLDKLKLSAGAINEIEKQTRGQATNNLWFLVKYMRLTASSCLKTKNFKKTVEELVKKQTVWIEDEEGKQVAYQPWLGEAVQWGIDHEEEAVEEYKRLKKPKQLRHSPGLVMHKDGIIGASCDAFVVDECGTSKLLEVKCPHSIKDPSIIDSEEKTIANLIRERKQKGEAPFYLNVAYRAGKPVYTLNKKTTSGLNYFKQCYTQMWVTQVKEIDFFVWTPYDTATVSMRLYNYDIASELADLQTCWEEEIPKIIKRQHIEMVSNI
jgi:hypothetical protein